jgi:ABC-type branched-subunit amino acid transport system permease subunit
MHAIRSLTPFFVFALGYALILTNSCYPLIMTLVLVWASFGLAWSVLSGYTGLVSFGHPGRGLSAAGGRRTADLAQEAALGFRGQVSGIRFQGSGSRTMVSEAWDLQPPGK